MFLDVRCKNLKLRTCCAYRNSIFTSGSYPCFENGERYLLVLYDTGGIWRRLSNLLPYPKFIISIADEAFSFLCEYEN